jgi:SAM-dependent methyltransferase
MSAGLNDENIKRYFGQKLETFGPTPRGADWNSIDAQRQRFAQLIKVIDPQEPFTIIDYGRGYGGLVDYLLEQGFRFHYTGYDLLEDMVLQARKIHQGRPFCEFTAEQGSLRSVDYTLASGIFNIKFEASDETWMASVMNTLQIMDRLSRRGFAFNMLTSYSDPEYMRPELYYANPGFIFDYCKRHFSQNVALLHDYTLYDFTILVRK